MALIFCIILPTLIPHYLWGETLWNAYFLTFALRYVITLNATWCVNSVAHMWGNRPYDKYISPAENHLVSLATSGEGYHNFHHTFPSDYSTSELGVGWNMSTALIDFCSWLGLAYDLKTVSNSLIKQRRLRTGDLQHLRTEWPNLNLTNGTSQWSKKKKSVPKNNCSFCTVIISWGAECETV